MFARSVNRFPGVRTLLRPAVDAAALAAILAMAASAQQPPKPQAAARTGPTSKRPAHDPVPLQISRMIPGVGAPMQMTVWTTDTARFEVLASATQDSLRALDSLVNAGREHSDVAAINSAAGGDPVPVSSQTLAILAQARRAWLVSGGLYDPTSVPFARALNAREQVGRVPGAAELDSLRALMDFGAVEISQTPRTVRLPKRGMELELDAVSRGAAMDVARRALRDPTTRGGVLRSGLYTMTFGRPPKSGKWAVVIGAPRTGRQAVGAAALDSAVMVIVSDSERTSPVADRHMRLVDMRTGRLAEGTASAIVIAPTGAEAGALASAFYMLGPERATRVADSLHAVSIMIREPALDTPVRRGDVLLSAAAESMVELIPALRTTFRLVPKPPPPRPPAN